MYCATARASWSVSGGSSGMIFAKLAISATLSVL
jgi:hypothetical protein